MVPEKVAAAVSPRTKAILLNSPNNPTGAVYSEGALRAVAAIAERNGLLVISDEVYECFVYDESRHFSVGSIYPDTLTLNAPYFSCHAKSRCSGNVSCTHLDEPPLINCNALAGAMVAGRDNNIWTWSATPPISMACILFCRAMPAIKGQRRRCNAGVINGRRSLVLKTQ